MCTSGREDVYISIASLRCVRGLLPIFTPFYITFQASIVVPCKSNPISVTTRTHVFSSPGRNVDADFASVRDILTKYLKGPSCSAAGACVDMSLPGRCCAPPSTTVPFCTRAFMTRSPSPNIFLKVTVRCLCVIGATSFPITTSCPLRSFINYSGVLCHLPSDNVRGLYQSCHPPI